MPLPDKPSDELEVGPDVTATPGRRNLSAHRHGEYLVCIEGDRSWTQRLPDTGELVIGRDPGCGLALNDALVSRQHAQILTVPDGLRLTDLGSRHGTQVNGERLTAPMLVVSGDVITVGSSVLIVRSRAVTVGRYVVDRQTLARKLAEELARALQYQRELAIVMIRTADADPARAMAVVADAVRVMDAVAPAEDGAFVVMLPELGVDEAIAVATELRRRLAGVAGGISVGVAAAPADGIDADTLIGAARDALAGTASGAIVVAGAVATETVGAREVVVGDPVMRRLYDLARRLARAALPVLIEGETGVGKEMAAATIHHASPRRDAPFISVNCAAIPETLAESELFGHARGAFSGAVTARVGQIEAASGGTLFLDEIGELTLPVQAKLLRVLETGELTRVGEVAPRAIDLRVVAATNRDLDAEVEAGRFRRDLMFRLGAARLTLPPLRDRPRDLSLLIRELLARACERVGRRRLPLSVAATYALFLHDWPGNVRELKNTLDYAVTAAPDDATELETWHLPAPLAAMARAQDADRLDQDISAVGLVVPPGDPAAAAAPAPPSGPRQFRPIADEVRELERARMVEALRATDGVQNRAAELIEMPLRTFATKLKRYAIEADDWSKR
jgi:two-component system response regulator AtoC